MLFCLSSEHQGLHAACGMRSLAWAMCKLGSSMILSFVEAAAAERVGRLAGLALPRPAHLPHNHPRGKHDGRLL